MRASDFHVITGAPGSGKTAILDRLRSDTHCVDEPARERYHPEVFVLAPWEQIYVVDDERTMSFADTLPFHTALVDAYRGAGYMLVEVPRGSAEHRAAFARDQITSS